MEWLVLAAPSILLIAVLVVPGWGVLTLLGRSGLAALTAAPAVSLGVVVLAALLVEATGWRWGLVPVALTSLIVAAVAFAARRWTGPDLGAAQDLAWRWRNPTAWAGALMVVGSLLLWARHLTNVLPEPTSISQTYDNVFHLNVIRFISDTGDPGPWLPRDLNPAEGRTILYPTAWHQLAALAMPLTGGSVQLASNALLFVVCAVVWPLCALELCIALGVRTPAALLGAGVLAGAFSSYPFLMLDWGVLYPNLLSYAVIPATLALLAALVRAGPDTRTPLVPLLLVSGVAVLGTAVAHPNGALLVLALTLPAVGSGALTTWHLARRRETSWVRAAVWWVVAAGALAAFVRLWLFARPSSRPWEPLHDIPTALGQALYGNPIMGPPGPIPAFLAAIGFVLLALRPQHRWYIGAALVGLALWVIGSGAPDGPVRELLTGAWYSDSYRLAPILGLVSVPAAAYAIDRTVRWLQPDAPPRRANAETVHAHGTRTRRQVVVATLVIPALLLVSTQWSPSMHHAVTHARISYDFVVAPCTDTALSCLLTQDEYDVLEALPRLTPPDAVILADPFTGASLAYAFADRRVLRPYIGASASPAEQVLIERLDSAPDDPAVCQAIVDSGVTHVLDFGLQSVHTYDIHAPGLDELAGSPRVRELFRQGPAVLYEVVGCS